jgi:hypothetical protein
MGLWEQNKGTLCVSLGFQIAYLLLQTSKEIWFLKRLLIQMLVRQGLELIINYFK